MTRALRGALLATSIIGVVFVAFTLVFLGISLANGLLIMVPALVGLAGFLIVDRYGSNARLRVVGLAIIWVVAFAASAIIQV